MISPRPILARYRLVVLGPYVCFPLMYVQNLLATHAFAFFVLLCGLFYNSLLPLRVGFIWYWALHFFQPISWLSSCPAILLGHSCYNDLIMLGLFKPAVYPFSNGLTWPWIFLLMGFYVPFVFPWASSAHLLALGFLGPFPKFVFPWAFTGFIGLP